VLVLGDVVGLEPVHGHAAGMLTGGDHALLAGDGALDDQLALELGKGGQELEEQPALGGAGVNVLGEGAEGDLAAAQVGDDVVQVDDRAAEPVELPDDLSASKYSPKPRQGYVQMLQDLQEGTINAVVVYDQDRLVRQPKELLEVCDRANAWHIAAVSGEIDVRNSDDLFRAHPGRSQC
jgi:hypothetical protein